MEKIGNSLLEYLKNKGLYDKLLEHQAVKVFNNEIKKQFPDLETSNAYDIADGVLTIEADNSVLKYEIFMKKHDIIEGINKIFSKKLVKDIAVRIVGGTE